MNHRGNRTHRFKQNPLEKVFSDKWEEANDKPNNGPGILAWSMGDGQFAGDISQRDATVAASIIQWLGSPVGQRFLLETLASPKAKDFRKELKFELEREK